MQHISRHTGHLPINIVATTRLSWNDDHDSPSSSASSEAFLEAFSSSFVPPGLRQGNFPLATSNHNAPHASSVILQRSTRRLSRRLPLLSRGSRDLLLISVTQILIRDEPGNDPYPFICLSRCRDKASARQKIGVSWRT